MLFSRLARSLFAGCVAVGMLVAGPAMGAEPKKDAAAKVADQKASKKDDAKTKGADPKAAKKDDAKVAKKDDAKAAKKDDPKAKVAKKDDAKAKAAGAKKDEPVALRDDIKGPASVGAPNKGRLQGAIKLHSSRSLKVRDKAQSWGTPSLVKLLQRAAGKVAKKHPRSVMLVGDLSRKTGGAMTGHNSHQSGRDADVAFYIANSKGQPAAMRRFVAFDGQGKSTQVTWAQFDDARNWALVEALLTDKDTTVRYIFVSNPLRSRMLQYAKAKKVAKDIYAKAESALLSPRDADVHDDHFHVRIACPDTMKGFCTEESHARGPAPAAAKPGPYGDDSAKTAPAAPAAAVPAASN